ncbi:MAG: adenylate/guanylate cyclase domain-containing protein [Armatimonadetes bacterium]|nr:adenylate/guanylate cyclase domain-containing protein [Armatimonadota bacterium]
MNRRAKAKLQWVAWGTFYATLSPLAFMALMFKIPWSLAVPASLTIGLFGGPAVGGILLFLVPYSRRYSFVVALALQTLALLVVGFIGFYLASNIIGMGTGRQSPFSIAFQRELLQQMGTNPDLIRAYWVTGLFGIVCLCIAQINSKLGHGVLVNWVLGRYHQPKEEERIFMFLDLKDSTPLAESLGNLKFSRLSQWFFRDVGEVLEAHKGQVSHFIGDEAVIYWTLKHGFNDAKCLRFFFELKREIAAKSERYEREFGVVPAFKAGVHCGRVVAAEVGYGKTEIVYQGDVLNTTARIVGKCAELGRDLLVSSAIAGALDSVPHGLRQVPVGEHVLKGKAAPVAILAVEETEA